MMKSCPLDLASSSSNISALAASAAVAITSLALSLMYLLRFRSSLPSVEFWRDHSSSNFLLLAVYAISLLAIFVLCCSKGRAVSISRSLWWQDKSIWFDRISAFMLIGYCCLSWLLFPHAGFGTALGAIAFVILRSKIDFVRSILRSSFLQRVVPPVALFVLATIALVPGLLTAVSFDGWWSGYLVPAENSYSVVMLTGDRLAAGALLGQDVFPRYGCIAPILSAVWQKTVGNISFGAYIGIVMWCQAVFALLAMVLYRRYARRISLSCLFALSMLLIPFSTSSIHVFYPNQAAIRFIGLPIAICFLSSLPRSPRAIFAGTGLLSGLLLLLNFEIGVVASAGLLSYLVVMNRRFAPNRRSVVEAVLLFVAGFCLAFGIFMSVVYFALGQSLSFSQLMRSLVPFGTVVASGNISGNIQPIMIIVFAHCCYVLLKTTWLSSIGELNHRQSMRVAISVMALLWLAYYVNKQSLYAVSGSCFLYGFLLIDIFRTALLKRPLTNRSVENRNNAALIIGAVALPFAFSLLIHHWPKLSDSCGRLLVSKQVQAPLRKVSGVYLSHELADSLLKKADYVRKHATKYGAAAYVTKHAALIPKLSGRLSDTGMESTYYDIRSPKKMNEFVSSLVNSKRDYLLFDAVKDEATPYDKCIVMVEEAISPYYERCDSVADWDVWRRRKN